MDKITNLSQTAELMSSENYKERFIAEYAQVKIRYLRLERMLQRVKDKSAPDCFEPPCDIRTLEKQSLYMISYLCVLIDRANIEDIDLPEVDV